MAADSVAGITAAEVEDVLGRILARPEFAAVEPPPLLRWSGAAFRWLGERLSPILRRLLPEVDFTGPGWEAFGWMVLGIGALLGLALLVYLAFLLIRAIRRRHRPAGRVNQPKPLPATPEEWEARARAAAAREDWRAAAMALYQAVLLRLSDAGALRLDRAKTPGDYRRDIRGDRRDIAAAFDAFLRRYERVAYGPEGAGAEQYDLLTDSAVRLAPGGAGG